MSVTWIMVANASQARLFANRGPNKGLELLREMVHPESRERAANLVSDRVGNYRGSGSYAQPTEPKQYEAERFALQVAHTLEDGRVQNAYDRLILVASAPFLGLVNERMNPQLKQKLSDSLNKDYTHLPARELAGHLGDRVFL